MARHARSLRVELTPDGVAVDVRDAVHQPRRQRSLAEFNGEVGDINPEQRSSLLDPEEADRSLVHCRSLDPTNSRLSILSPNLWITRAQRYLWIMRRGEDTPLALTQQPLPVSRLTSTNSSGRPRGAGLLLRVYLDQN